MSKHTPGDWQYENGWIVKKEEGKDPCRIAEVRGWGWLLHKHKNADGTSNQMECAKEQDANGMLLAAAPELLAALKELRSMCDRQKDFNDDEDGETLDRTDAAILKAEGGQQ